MDIQRMRHFIESIADIPTLPTIFRKLLRVIENPKVSLNEISSFISNDPALTSRVLKMVNSPIYGFPCRIYSINQALLLLGLNVVKGMLLGVSVFDVMQKTMIGLWEHSVGCAILARKIAQRKGLREPEEVFVSALLHDIGKVVLWLRFPEEYKRVIAVTEEKDIFIFEAEKNYFSINHADAGNWITQKWNFPKNLVEVIKYHHNPNLSKYVPMQTAIVHISDILIKARGFGFSGDNFVPAIDTSAWQTLDLSESDIKEILRETEELLEQTEDLFENE